MEDRQQRSPEAALQQDLESERALLREAVRRQDVDAFFTAADQLASADIPPMSLEEIQAEVNAVRATRKADWIAYLEKKNGTPLPAAGSARQFTE